MARRLDVPASVPPPRRTYDWDVWMDGSTWELVEGEDFAGDAESFRNRCYSMATKRDRRATVSKHDRDGRTVLHVTFFADSEGVSPNAAHAAGGSRGQQLDAA